MIGFFSSFLFLLSIFSILFSFSALGLSLGGMKDDGKVYELFEGRDSGEQLGIKITSLGDIDGDGMVDAGISTNPYDGQTMVYIISGESWYSQQFGGLQGSKEQVNNLIEKRGVKYLSIYSENKGDGLGYSISDLGDIDGDGYGDIGISSPFARDGVGIVSVIMGRADFFSLENQKETDIKEMVSYPKGFEVVGGRELESLGISLSSGDVNGDGNSDIIMGAYDMSGGAVSYGGSVYVYFGGESRVSDRVLIGDRVKNGGAVNFFGEQSGQGAGWSVKGVGDIDSDGYTDFVVGSPGFDNGRGKVYVVFGSENLGGEIPLGSVGFGRKGVQLLGEGSINEAGWSVGGGKDINSDGVPDIVIGARGAKGIDGEENAGRVYVIAGRSGLSGRLSLSEVGKSLPGYKLYGDEGTAAGISVDMLDDFNGDGIDDLIVGSLGYGGSSRIFMVFGGMDENNGGKGFSLSELIGHRGRITRGVSLDGEGDDAGISVYGMGDVNDDGFSDVLIGAPLSDSGDLKDAGSAYLLFGHKIVRDAELDAGRYIEGSVGGDPIGSSVSGSLRYAYDGDDTITLDEVDFSVLHGGKGSDSLIYRGSSLYIGPRQNFLFKSIETIDLGEASVSLKIESGVDLGLRKGDFLTVKADRDDEIILEGFEEENKAWHYVSDDGRISLKIEGDYTEGLGSALSGVSGEREIDLSRSFEGDFSMFSGTEVNMRGAYSLSSAGDFDGDGIDDVMFGSIYSSVGGRVRNGSVHVFYGRRMWQEGGFRIGSGDGISVLRISGSSTGDRIGWSVAGDGDINGDGVDDIVLGVPYFSRGSSSGIGKVYIIFGNHYGNVKEIDLSNTSDSGFEILEIEGEGSGDHTGWSVSLSDDVNGDGLGDVIIGVPKADSNGLRNSGRVLVLYGSKQLGGGKISAGQIGRSVSGLRLGGNSEGSRFGWSVSGAGDRDGDGLSEIVVGAPGGGGLGSDTLQAVLGRVYIFAGRSGSDFSTLDSSLVLRGEDLGIGTGFSVGGGKDVDGDGLADVVVGAMKAGDNFGKVYILDSGNNLVSVTGPHFRSRFGYSVGMVDDVNGDGISEVLVGSPSYGLELGENRGASYLLLGRDEWSSGGIDTTIDAIRIVGAESGGQMGLRVASGGDSNADGRGDILVGSYYSDPEGLNNGGIGYLIFGRDS